MASKLRRQDREIDNPELIREILKKGKFCHLAMVDNGKPYLITMNYGYRDNVIYLHAALEGRKIEVLSENPEVCFQVVIDTRLVTGEDACKNWTMKYKSLVGYGKATFIKNDEEKIQALNVLMNQYTTKGPFEFSGSNLEETAVIKIDISSLCGKMSGY
jgi:uncharacterized protein